MKGLRTALVAKAATLFFLALTSQSAQSVVIVNDSFADGDRTKTGALDADWWSSSSSGGNSVEIAPGALGLVSGTSGRGIHATFAPQTLAVGQNITVTYSFTTPATIGVDKDTSLKVALMDLNSPALAADLNSSSSTPNPLYVGQPGYWTDFDVDGGTGGLLPEYNTGIREHDVAATSGRFLGTSGEWISLGSSLGSGYTFAPSTAYVGVFSITRTASGVDITSTLSLDGGAMLDSHTESDNDGTIANNFGMLGFWVNSNTFGSTNASDPDNGITFTNVTIDSTGSVVSSGNVIVDDSFADGDRAATGLGGELDASWWSSNQASGTNVQAGVGTMTLVSGTSGRGMHATFAPQVLDIGDNITATYSFTTPATVGEVSSTSFKIAMMDGTNPGLAADLVSQSGVGNENPLYVGLPGYFTAFDVTTTGTLVTNQDTDLRKHDVASPLGRFLGTTGEWTSISSSADAGYIFTPNTDYVGVFSITRTGSDSVQITSSLSLAAGGLIDSHTDSDISGIANNFGMLGFWANSNAFGSSSVENTPDNGLIFTNLLIESTGTPAEPDIVPEAYAPVPLWALLLLGLSLVGTQLRSRIN